MLAYEPWNADRLSADFFIKASFEGCSLLYSHEPCSGKSGESIIIFQDHISGVQLFSNMATTETRTETDLSGLTDSMNRVGLNHDTAEDNRVGPDGEAAPRTDEEYAKSQLTLRAIVSSKEAGVIIGKAGKNVADLRDETGVKAGVSKVVQGVHDRVLTVTGELEGISKAYAIVAKGLLEGAPQMGMGGAISTNGTHRKFTLLQLNLVSCNVPLHHSCAPQSRLYLRIL